MAATLIASLTGFLLTDSRRDVENDTNASAASTIFVRVEPGGANNGVGTITATQVTSALTGITSASPCQVIITQGAGSYTTTGAAAIGPFVGFLLTDSRRDVESDTTAATMSTVFVRVEPGGAANGVGNLTLTVPTSALTGITTGTPCSVSVLQGSGTLAVTMPQ